MIQYNELIINLKQLVWVKDAKVYHGDDIDVAVVEIIGRIGGSGVEFLATTPISIQNVLGEDNMDNAIGLIQDLVMEAHGRSDWEKKK